MDGPNQRLAVLGKIIIVTIPLHRLATNPRSALEQFLFGHCQVDE
jgi:hypothetical protein